MSGPSPSPSRSARHRGFALLLALAACGGPPTLSRPGAPEHRDALARGDRHRHHGRTDAALAAYDEAARLARRRVDADTARYRQARVLRRAGRYAEALAVLDAMAAVRPPSRRTSRALFDAARLRLDRFAGDPAMRRRAQEGLAEVVRRFPNDGNASRALRLWLASLRSDGERRELLAGLATEVGASRLGDDVLFRLAELQLAAGDRSLARASLERLVREHPYPHGHRWDDAIFLLGALDREDGRPGDAIARYGRMLERAETTTIVGSYTLPSFAAAQLAIARLERERGDTAAAMEAYARTYERFTRSRLRDDAMAEHAELLLASGDAPGACRLLRRVVEEFSVGSARRRATQLHAERCEAR
ncbi:MAG: tetratricopeptide repeat protein [Myxococcota bacterium]